MFSFLLGCLLLFLLLSGAKSVLRGNPRVLAMKGERILAAIIFITVIVLLLAGLWIVALIVLPMVLALLGLHMLWNPALPNMALPRFRTRYLDAAIDIRTKQMRAQVRSGKHAGFNLDKLALEDILGLFNEFADDPESCSLLAAYLDRRFPHWRKDPHAHAHTRQAGARSTHALSEEEAYEILGLQKGATVEEIREAHRRLMKRLHPDIGGTAWLAAKLNAAKELLVETHYKNSTRSN
ncbi:MAG: DnaJ domain-containing protein [Pseudomonadota bacterium]